MITKTQAMEAREFHEEGSCKVQRGPRGGIRIRSTVWRRNGATKTWKTRPDEFRVPVKFGLRQCTYITEKNAHVVHAPEDCPLNNCVDCGEKGHMACGSQRCVDCGELGHAAVAMECQYPSEHHGHHNSRLSTRTHGGE